MCGIVGATSRTGAVLEGMIEGLRVLEYRGYDSCGVAVADGERIEIRRKVGRLSELEKLLVDGALSNARIGVGHPGDRNQVVDYVLKKPRSEERSLIEEALERSLDAWPLLAEGEYPAAMQKINTRPASPAP